MLELINSFLEMLSATRYSAQNTIAAYKRDLHWFASQIKKPVIELSEEDVNAVFLKAGAENLKSSTITRRIIAVRQFFTYLYSIEYCEHNPAMGLELPKAQQNLPKIMSEEDVDKLLQLAKEEAELTYSDDNAKLRAVRLYALLCILYASGLRISELCSLPSLALKQNQDFILVKGKGGKERFVPLNEESKEAIATWLDFRKYKFAKKHPYLFPANSVSKHVARQVVAREIKALAKRAGLVYTQISPHVFRHSLASHMLKYGADLLVLQKLLGHSDISSTQIYTHIMDDKLYKTVEDYHPLAQKLNR